MPSHFDRMEFAPPPQPGLLRGFSLAIIAHLLLVAALTWGVNWQREAPELSAAAELWSAVPQEAAPPPPPPVVAPPSPLTPPPVVRAPPEPTQRQADIAEEREKERKLERERREAEQAAREREKQREEEAERKREEAAERKKEQARLAAEQRKAEAEKKKRQEEQQEKRLAQLREENMRRMQGLAGGGSPGSTGAAAQSSGPSASWAGRVRARVKPNIVFTEDVSGNPEARVEVRLAPDGTIVGKRVVKSSGHRGWDEAVLRALDKTEVLPRDVDGRVPTPVELVFRPKD